MLSDLDHFYLQQEEPIKSSLLALRTIILSHDENFSAEWKYKMPFFYYRGKMLCYIWIRKTKGQVYLGLMDGHRIDHPLLITEKRARIKIMLIDADKDLPVQTIRSILTQAIGFY